MLLLRWRFDFVDRAPVISTWSNSGPKEGHASNVDLSGLSSASIEAKSILTKEIKTVAHCPGYMFKKFEWEAVRGLFTGRGEVIGLKLFTDDKDVVVRTNGTAFVSYPNNKKATPDCHILGVE